MIRQANFHPTLPKIIMEVHHSRQGEDSLVHRALWLVDIPPHVISDTQPCEDVSSDPANMTRESIQIKITHSFWIPSVWPQPVKSDRQIPETYIFVWELVVRNSLHAGETVALALCLTPEGKLEAIPIGSFPIEWRATRLQLRVIRSLPSQDQLAICFLCPLERTLKKKILSLPSIGSVCDAVMIRQFDPLYGQIVLELLGSRDPRTGISERQSYVVQY